MAADLRSRRGVDRREFLLAASGSCLSALASACSRGALSDAPRVPRDPLVLGANPGPVHLWSFFDLPADDPRSRELSGVAWDASGNVLWAVHEESPSIVALVPDRDLQTWRFGETIAIDITGPLDLEGLVIVPEGFIVCSEEGPRVIELNRKGRLRREVAVPPRFRDARPNKSIESLTVSPSGRYLFVTTEAALRHDGEPATATSGTRIRIARIDRQTGEVSEHAYETDPVPWDVGELGVSDLAAISDSELFVLERGWSKGHGNTVRIYQTSLEAHASSLAVEHLSSMAAVLTKALRVDLSKLVATGLPVPKQPQPSALLDNYEGLALGPQLRDGRQTLLTVSDDNGRADQVARLVVLALSGDPPRRARQELR